MADDEFPELQNSETVGTVTLTHGAWWDEHSDVFDEAVAVLAWEELHVDGRTVGPVIEERPAQRLTISVEEAATALGISRTFAYDAVACGEISCIRIDRRILVPKAGLNRLLESAGTAPQES